MTGARSPHQAAAAATEQIRSLGEITARPGCFPYPIDAHHTLGALAGMLEQLPLTLHQTAAAINAIPDQHLAVLDDPPIPSRVQAVVATELGLAIAALEEAATHLRRAQHTTAELLYTGPMPGP
ncbi:hypothetical protein [Streptacidiphilus sp. MAP5-3]|uniref:hypothetical protein n=1 Tax=unclassified Streptacidiphilus TaxID=2643834 RepID=UPI0035112E8D